MSTFPPETNPLEQALQRTSSLDDAFQGSETLGSLWGRDQQGEGRKESWPEDLDHQVLSGSGLSLTLTREALFNPKYKFIQPSCVRVSVHHRAEFLAGRLLCTSSSQSVLAAHLPWASSGKM